MAREVGADWLPGTWIGEREKQYAHIGCARDLGHHLPFPLPIRGGLGADLCAIGRLLWHD